ncbi:MAG: ATP-dependent Clp protease ATP-binding subunit, partial [Alistipes sp.]|nr:ATP-dependent Clp protease ATP-binding subunit [Alistipes sp.]
TLARYRITAETLREELRRLETEGPTRQESEHAIRDLMRVDTPSSLRLERFGTDLTREAREGRIDPVVGREREIERLIQILARRKKNNPILLGEAGVGKTAVIEGLALRMAHGKVPHSLREKRLVALNLTALVAGTKFRGEFEERMQQLLEEVQRTKNTILFIDEIHTMVGAGSTQGSLDTANILKPALARGELQLIGATTFEEYRRDMEQDGALERRFQRLVIEPPTADETLRILEQIAPSYALHHRVRYAPEALRAIVTLAERYLTGRSFPDKAIDLMDEAGARAHLRSQTHQEEELPRVEVADIEQLITEQTTIPVERLTSNEATRLRGLQAHLAERVIGQEEAVERLSQAVMRARAGLREPHRPMGVFLFTGPTGVGKTLLAKELSKWLFDEKRGLIRLDMSEYSEKHNVARLIGSPPGYVGYGEGGQLTEAVRRQPYAVVLFDEIEKAHPEVFGTLLQLFDEGHLTDGNGRKVDFRHTIVVMTSNVGSREAIARPIRMGYNTRTNDKRSDHDALYLKALERSFAPEFLNRIDEVVRFRQLERSDIERILHLELEGLISRTTQLGYRLEITPAAREELTTLGYETRYGARALKRTLQRHLETP